MNDIVPMLVAVVVWVGTYGWARRYRPHDVSRLKDLGRRYARADIDQRELLRGYRPYLYVGLAAWLGLMIAFYALEARLRM